ncbi:glycosyltransferase [Clostridium perfringens]|uniref:glycosyltransferase n=1 Tax=Clostridium perfringens TaxID=1502 RepID=UPI0024BC5125|nr:glycosyltransferase [Clostridium perfringens]EIF6290040.1 glycosyltransferase [Clostridium perfringens]EJT6534363.1 glycosyltransferase [Clostridium perfringens]MDM0780044.1 glycosyltransferase [Clostridium perfringens]MDM0791860.1 glycosyltransferase [Clostridium perfringens]MDM0816026.1 glycosyltransferase [Clostridium perfringens]
MNSLDKNCLVSIIIPTYNRADRILKTLKSAINQSYKNIEIIIIDDNSDDNTEQIVKKYLNDKVHYYKNKVNLGGAKSRNVGVKKSNGDIIAFLDSDDEWLENKIQLQIEKFLKNKDVGMVYTKYLLINEITGEKIKFDCEKVFEKDFHSLLCQNYIGTTSSICIKKDIFEQIGGFDENLPSCQDWDLYIRIAQVCKIEKVEDICLNYYFHNNSITGNSKNTIIGHNIIIKKINSILEKNKLEEEKIIKSYNFRRMANVYMKNRMIKEGRKNFKKSMLYKFNKQSLQHLIASYLGENIYFKLKKL